MSAALDSGPKRRFRLVGVGGTFDALHQGHEALLRTALRLGERVIVGVAIDEFVERMKKTYQVHPYSVRVRRIQRFLKHEKALERAEVVPIEDPHGPAAKDRGMEALVVSKQTLRTAEEINEIRQDSGLPLLELIAIEMVLADDNKPISSRRIRKGEITRTGVARGKSSKRKSG